MKPGLVSRLLNTFIMIMFLAILALMGAAIHFENELSTAEELRVTSLQLASELRQSSQDLTSAVRTYVVTGDPRYRDEYLQILGRRNGHLPRPDGRTISLLQLMIDAGISQEELKFLATANTRSDTLSKSEEEAISKMGEPSRTMGGHYVIKKPEHQDEAIQLVYNFKYRKAVDDIMEPILRFNDLINQRTEAHVETLRFYMHTTLLVATLLVLLVALASYLAPTFIHQLEDK